ncbi:MAG: hypothetical protein GX044_00025 [Firmicutes bacterium]|jgi:hypothetical protein|nr:hypothetical protein [Bacillota bacterium]
MKRKNTFAIITGFGLAVSFSIVVCGIFIPDIPIWMLLPVSIPASVYSAVFWIREYKKLQTARLIAENQILHISTAVISDEADATEKSENTENIEAIISYFGILLDEKIIKFNQGGIQLRAVEIGSDFISFTYGTEKRAQNIRLLRPAIDPPTIAEISERFRYETGITPTLLF